MTICVEKARVLFTILLSMSSLKETNPSLYERVFIRSRVCNLNTLVNISPLLGDGGVKFKDSIFRQNLGIANKRIFGSARPKRSYEFEVDVFDI